MRGMDQPPPARPRIANPAIITGAAPGPTTATHGGVLERQLDALLKPTTVADLARRGGQIKAMKERDLRDLIRQSILTLMQGSPSLAGIDQEQLLDRVQAELVRSMAAKATERAERESLLAELAALGERQARTNAESAAVAAELDRLRRRLADAEQEAATLRAGLEAAHSDAGVSRELDAWAHEIDALWFAGRHQRQRAPGTSLLESLASHLAACQQLLADYPASPPGSDPAGDVIARIKALAALRLQDQGWIAELQKRQGVLLAEREQLQAERDSGQAALDEESARSIEAEAHADHLAEQVAALQQRIVDLEALPTETAPVAVWHEELAELRERIAESQARLDDASAARIRAERELATAATGRTTAERRLAESTAQVSELSGRLQTLEAQITDQRKTTDLARLASVEAEALRAEIEGLKLLLRERESVLADERARAHADRDRHRVENANRLDAMRRVELALVQLKDQLAAAEGLLAERDAECGRLRAALSEAQASPAITSSDLPTPIPGPAAEPAGQAAELDLLTQLTELRRELQHAGESLTAAEIARKNAETHIIALSSERQRLRQALLALAARIPPAADAPA